MIRCIIIEDQPPAQRVLKTYIDEIGNIELKATFTDALQAIDFLKTEPVDLIFLDVHLPKISGIDFLRTLAQNPYTIVTTAFSDYALESYEYNVVDYLLKPFSFERFVKAVSKLPSFQRERSPMKGLKQQEHYSNVLFVKSGYEHIKIDIDEICFIRSDADYTEIHLANMKYLSQEPLRHWEECLDPDKFARIHKSYILNISKIQKITGNRVFLDENTIIPIGRAYKDDFMKQVLG